MFLEKIKSILFRDRKLIKRCSVYISEVYDEIIIVPKSVDKSGVIYEQAKCVVLSKGCALEVLGEEIMKAMNRFQYKETDRTKFKLTDWPAFKHSKSKSVKSFEKEYISISLDGCNSSNLIFSVEGIPFKNSEVNIVTSVSFYAKNEGIAQKIMKVYTACLTRKF